METEHTHAKRSRAVASSKLDPSCPGTIIQIACAVEALINFTIFIPMIFTPVSYLVGQFALSSGPNNELAHGTPPPLAAFLSQLLGACMFSPTIGLILAVPNRSGAIERRRVAYFGLLSIEIGWIFLCVWYPFVVGEEISGLSKEKILKSFIVPMALFAMFRSFAFLFKPHWFGRYVDQKAE